jgi:hypothetical protein
MEDVRYSSNIIKATQPFRDIDFVFYYIEEKDPTTNC